MKTQDRPAYAQIFRAYTQCKHIASQIYPCNAPVLFTQHVVQLCEKKNVHFLIPCTNNPLGLYWITRRQNWDLDFLSRRALPISMEF